MMETSTRAGMPLDDFIREMNDQPFELINGERKLKLPGVAGHNYVIHLLYRALLQFLLQTQMGEVFIEATFILPGEDNRDWVEGSRTPDILFFSAERFQNYVTQNPDWKSRPYALVPDLVVEVVSPNDRYTDLEEKVDAYLLDSVKLIWVIDPQRRKANVYRPQDERLTRLGADETLDGEDILPGFQLSLMTLFEER
jgi:Uma2 family endonuclease